MPKTLIVSPRRRKFTQRTILTKMIAMTMSTIYLKKSANQNQEDLVVQFLLKPLDLGTKELLFK